jgi:hypothetical protein
VNLDTKIIFDVASKPYPHLLFWNCLVAFVFGCILLLLAKIPWPDSARVMRFFGYFFCVCSLVTLGYYSTRWYLDRLKDIRYLSNGSFQIVEGPVENFHPQLPNVSSTESFTVSGHKFVYSDYVESWITTCFNRTTLNNGPIHPGMVLRIKYRDNCILEIDQLPGSPAAPPSRELPPNPEKPTSQQTKHQHRAGL